MARRTGGWKLKDGRIFRKQASLSPSPRNVSAKRAIVFFLAAMTMSPLVFSGAAFSAPIESEIGVVKRETQAAKNVQKTAKKAVQKTEFAAAQKIILDDILKDPDNAELNFHYAEQQAANENLLGAAGTLERILISHPEYEEVRLFYAVVLFRLDNLIEAENELAVLSASKLPSDLQSEVQRYQKEIKKRKKKTHLAVRQTLGYGFDTNRNSAASSKEVLFSETPISLTGTSTRQDDTHFLNITSVDVAHDLGFQAGHQVIGNFTYFQQEQTHVDSLDLSSFQYELGSLLKTRFFNFTPTFQASHVFLSRENYLRTQGGNFLIDRTFNKLELNTAFKIERHDYLPIEENSAARDRDGEEETFGWGASYILFPSVKTGFGLIYAHKNARADYEDYNNFGMRHGISWLLGRGHFILNTIDAGFVYYEHPDVAIASRIRRDQTIRERVTYGFPLGSVTPKILPAFLRDVTWSFTVEYFRAYSTITNYTYTNFKYQSLLTKNWEF